MIQNGGGSSGASGNSPKRNSRYAGINPSPSPREPQRRPDVNEAEEKAKKYLQTHPSSIAQNAAKTKPGALDPGIAAVGVSALAQQILVYHESEPAAAGNDWMYKLKEESMQFLADQKGVELQKGQREQVYKKGIETLIDKIFALLQRFTFEFNQIAAGTDLHVSGTISGDVTEVTQYNKMREAIESETYFRARVSTRLFSLVLRGRNESVEFYLLPVNKVMALSKSEKQYRPLARIQVRISEEGMMWRMENGVPAVDSMDELCMWLFSNLINETKHATAAAEAAAALAASQAEQAQ
jgi:hypothetical protein